MGVCFVQVFGGLAPSLYVGELYPTPVYKEWFYEVMLVDIQVDGHSLNMDCKEVGRTRVGGDGMIPSLHGIICIDRKKCIQYDILQYNTGIFSVM